MCKNSAALKIPFEMTTLSKSFPNCAQTYPQELWTKNDTAEMTTDNSGLRCFLNGRNMLLLQSRQLLF